MPQKNYGGTKACTTNSKTKFDIFVGCDRKVGFQFLVLKYASTEIHVEYRLL